MRFLACETDEDSVITPLIRPDRFDGNPNAVALFYFQSQSLLEIVIQHLDFLREQPCAATRSRDCF